VNSQSVVVGFPINTIEIMDLSFDKYLLLREKVASRVVDVKKFNAVLS